MTYSEATNYPKAKYNGSGNFQENLTTNISQQIQGIIARRRKQAEQVKQVKQNLLSRQETLQKLQNERQTLIANNPNLEERLKETDLTYTLESVTSVQIELENLEKRLSRDTLNIGVVGRMRNGKSCLLQSLTGLGQEHIPTSSQGVCTRGLSKIIHVSDPTEERNEIEFHTWSSFKEIIHLYFDKLGLPDKPVVPDDMAYGKRPPGLPKEKQGDINARYLYGRLCKEYYGKFDSYRDLLDGSSRQILTSEITQYITYNEGHSQGEYLAVKELRVFCPFTFHQEVGQIGVIDLPGLGDDNIFDLERLITTLKRDVDVILFVRMPKPTGDDWEEADRKMFQTAREALGEFPLSDCSFVVLNRIQEGNIDNYELCQLFGNKIDRQEITINHNPIIANCSVAHEVKQNILTPVLNYLANNSELVYEKYLQSCNRRLKVLQSNITKQLEQAESAIAGYSEEGGGEFDFWFDGELWNNLSGGLYELLDELRQKQNLDDETFKAAVAEAVDRCNGEGIVPQVADIEKAKYNYGSSYKITYLVYVDEIRAKLSRNFNSLGNSLGTLLEEVQDSLVDVLVTKGKLEKLTPYRGQEFFQEIVKQIPRNASQLRQGFEDIEKQGNAFDQVVKEWIKSHLEELLPDKKIDPISQLEIQTSGDDNSAFQKVLDSIDEFKDRGNQDLLNSISNTVRQAITPQQMKEIIEHTLNPTVDFLESQIQDNEEEVGAVHSSEVELSDAELIEADLQALRQDIVYRCHEALQAKLSQPNQLAFTMIRDFLDRVLSAPGVQTEWRTFLRRNKSLVWDGAKQKQYYEELEKNWLKLVNSAQTANSAEDLRLTLNANVF